MWKNVGNHPQDEVLLHCFFLKSISLPVGQESPSLTIFTLGLDLGSCNYNQPLCSEIHTLWTFGSSLSLIPKSSALPKLGSRFGTPWFDHKSTTSPGMSSLWPPTAPRRGESVGLPGGFWHLAKSMGLVRKSPWKWASISIERERIYIYISISSLCKQRMKILNTLW